MEPFWIISSLLLFSVFCFAVSSYLRARSRMITENTSDVQSEGDAFVLYRNWCKQRSEAPMPIESFRSLADENGQVSLARLMNLHREFNPMALEDKEADDRETMSGPPDDRLKKREAQIKRDKEFLTSATAGYLTDSTIAGTLIGGSFLGGLVGSWLKKKKKKK